MNRKEKINYLKGIASGSISIDDLKPKHFKIEGFTDTGKGRFHINGKVVDSDTYGKEIVKIKSEDEVTIIIDGRELK